MRQFGVVCALAIAFGASCARVNAVRTLDIYFIDVEGGQSTLVVTPAGESLLVDTGYAGFDNRDSKRILAAARDARIERIDYLLMTHFHPDHDGGVVDLARRIPIRAFVDHGELALPEAKSDAEWPHISAAFDAYAAVRAKGPHLEPKPGDRLPLKDVDVEIVSSGGATLRDAVDGESRPNRDCEASAPPPQEAIENPRSTGFRLRLGRFRFIDLGDLTGKPLFALFCPNNLLGEADVYLVPHHGGPDAVFPAMFALRPRVAILNNGATKGGAPEAFTVLRNVQRAQRARRPQRAQRLEDVWQLHRSANPRSTNFSEGRIANLDETTSYWIKVSGQEDGSFSVTNGRTGATKRYPVSGSSRTGSR